MTTAEITAAIASRMGFVPPFFQPAEESPLLLGQLWQQTLSADLDNPLPARFKERLSAYLSRYCTVPYSLVCHSCALAALGVAPAEILTLLETPVPGEGEVERALDLLGEQAAPLAAFPDPDSVLAAAILRIAVYFFLNRDRAARCRAALRRLLGDRDYNHLIALLAHVKASHVWVEAHPELSYELDKRAQDHLPGLLAGEPRLAELFRLYRERARREYRRLEERLVADLDRHRQAEVERTGLLERERVARAEAEAASRAKDDFLATISHELRTPLTAVLAWPLILRGKLDDKAALTHGLTVIERNAQLQAQIIEDLLEVSRIVAGKLRLDLRPLELTAVLAAAADAVRRAAETKGVTLAVQVDEPVGLVQGDPARLQQILWNLLSNAIKFTGPGGRVEMALERTPTHAVIRVRDDGIGIAPEFLPHVFERFRQADSSTTRRHGGLGLGLAIVRHLVELHGGTVVADSAGPGRGSAFVVEIPLLAPEMPDMPEMPEMLEASERLPPRRVTGAAAAAPRADLSGLSLVIVDDEPDTLEMLAEVLSAHGAAVRACRGAAEALAALAEQPADALLSDIAMPEADGYELIRRVRALPGRNGTLPAVALTAYARAEDRDRSLAAGYQVHLAKPVSPAHLVATVQRLAR